MTGVRTSIAMVALGAALATGAYGCRKQVPPQAPASTSPSLATSVNLPPPPPTAPLLPPEVKAPAPLTEDDIFARKSLDQLNAERPLDDVFFDYDQAVIRNDARPMMQKNAVWLKRWSTTQITIDGHSDSRGSSEYNLALASRRADAVKQYLVSLDVAANRITVVSKGKEQPFCSEDAESCWAQNRRGHNIITAK